MELKNQNSKVKNLVTGKPVFDFLLFTYFKYSRRQFDYVTILPLS